MSDLSNERLKKKVDFDLLKPQNALKKSQVANDLVVVLKQKVADYPATHNLKSCNEFLLYTCKIVENLIKKSDGINKKELVKDVFKQLFNLQPAELLLIDSAIEFLWGNNLIVKIPLIKKSVSFLKKKFSYIL